ncbi:hypothetical protein ACTFIY_003463 [Dictyostelium cf. discoideum]
MSGKEDFDSPPNSSVLPSSSPHIIDINTGITVVNVVTIVNAERCIEEINSKKNLKNFDLRYLEGFLNNLIEEKEKEHETRLNTFMNEREQEYKRKKRVKKKEETIARLEKEKAELVKRVEELEESLLKVQSINCQYQLIKEGRKAAAYNYSAEVSNYYLKNSLLPLFTTTPGYVSFENQFRINNNNKTPPNFAKYFQTNYYNDPDIVARAKKDHNVDLLHLYDLIFYRNKNVAHCVSERYEEIQDVYKMAMDNYYDLIDGDHQVLLKTLKAIIPPPFDFWYTNIS